MLDGRDNDTKEVEQKNPISFLSGENKYPFIEMNCEGKNEGSIPLPPTLSSGVWKRPATVTFSLSPEMQVQAWNLFRVQEHSPGAKDSLIQPLLSCFSLRTLVWISSYLTFSTA